MTNHEVIMDAKWYRTISELEERSYQEVMFDMEDISFAYFLARDGINEIEIKVCLESSSFYQRDIGCEDWWYVDFIEPTIYQ
ncbi:hypothetical protein [Thalassobacillus sp. CUG 92003]|uniref:hypothetical protein n=1 Tax=Thalassobacillus sp. CUG 92003 TaxID=2736641 RepID=UPI0015E6C6E2|nr:hypothetical protein [Thalassobacillus sp. CUG 92003]